MTSSTIPRLTEEKIRALWDYDDTNPFSIMELEFARLLEDAMREAIADALLKHTNERLSHVELASLLRDGGQ